MLYLMQRLNVCPGGYLYFEFSFLNTRYVLNQLLIWPVSTIPAA